MEPVGSEVAPPAHTFTASEISATAPDARGRIVRDNGRLVLAEAAVVPPRVAPGGTTRVHLVFRPNAAIKAHWNNEVEPLRVWVSVPQGWAIDTPFLTVPNPAEILSTDMRQLQFCKARPAPPVSCACLRMRCTTCARTSTARVCTGARTST